MAQPAPTSTAATSTNGSNTPEASASAVHISNVGTLCDQGSDGRRWPRGFANEVKYRVLHFTPSWFAVNMGTGISASIIHQFPYSFSGQNEISYVIFAWNTLLFLIFLFASIIRYAVWPEVFWRMMEHNVQSLFLGTFAMGFATIVAFLPIFGGHWVTLAWALWWIDSLVSLLIATVVPYFMFTRHKHEIAGVTGVWLLPLVTLVVAAATGGTVALHLPPTHARLTVEICYWMMGIGLLTALLVQAVYIQRLACHKLPPAAVVVSVFLPLGPCGQSGFGLLQLAHVGRMLQANTGRGLIFDGQEGQMMTSAISAISYLSAMALFGLGSWWLILALLTISRAVRGKGFSFNMGWWGFTFPLGTMANSAVALGTDMNSMAWKIVGSILSASVVLLWLFVTVKTAIGSFKGTTFTAPCLGISGLPPPKRRKEKSEAAATMV